MSKAKNHQYLDILHKYGKEGVSALSSATPIDSGQTANSWEYRIERKQNTTSLYWINTNVVNNVPIAIILQYGHVTGTGGFVQGVDYINPAMKPVFDRLSNDLWKEIKAL